MKLFVVLGHVEGTAVCIKATSKVDVYLNNKEMRAGCVYYEAGETGYFIKDTAIQPDNQFPISHEHIRSCHRDRIFEDLGILPRGFGEALKSAMNNSITMDERKKKRISELIGF
jgi:hypothetical protein